MTNISVFFRLIEDGRVQIAADVHVGDIFAGGRKDKWDRLCMDLNGIITVTVIC